MVEMNDFMPNLYGIIVASPKERTLIGRISDIVRSGLGSDFVA